MNWLKQALEKIDVKMIEYEKRTNNIFEWAWYITVKVENKSISKALKLKDDILFSVSTNWALSTIEDEIEKVLNEFKEKYSLKAYQNTILL